MTDEKIVEMEKRLEFLEEQEAIRSKPIDADAFMNGMITNLLSAGVLTEPDDIAKVSSLLCPSSAH